LGLVGLGWVETRRVRFGSVWFNSVGLDWVGLSQAELSRAEPSFVGLGQARLGLSLLGRNGAAVCWAGASIVILSAAVAAAAPTL